MPWLRWDVYSRTNINIGCNNSIGNLHQMWIMLFDTIRDVNSSISVDFYYYILI